jgi:PAS domain S-box-containing protein
MRLTIPPDLSHVAEVRDWLAELASGVALSDSRLYDLQVAASEAAANAVEHGGGDVELAASLLPDRLILEVISTGRFQPGLYKDDVQHRRGLGLPLMVSLADHVHVARLEGEKTSVLLTFFFDGYRAQTSQADGPPPKGGQKEIQAGTAVSGDGQPAPAGVARLAWLSIPLFVIAIVVLSALGIDAVRDSRVVYTTFSTLFVSAAGLAIAYLAARSYVASGAGNILSFGAAALALAVTYVLAGVFYTTREHLITLHNVGFCLSGALFVASAIWSLADRPPRTDRVRARRDVVLAYLTVLLVMGAVVWVTMVEKSPDFYVEGQGYTLLRHFVFGTGIVAFVVASGLFLLLYRRIPSHFLLWCFTGLGLFGAVTAVTVLTGAVPGSATAWASRSGQWLAGVYLLVAVFSLEPRREWVLPLKQSLREAEDRYKSLVDLSPEPILVHADGVFVFANPAAARFFAASAPQEIVGRDLLDLVHPTDRPLVSARSDLGYAGAVTPRRVIRYLRLDGVTVEGEGVGTRIDFGGRQAIQLVVRDLTERRRAEEALLASEERFRALVTASSDVLYRMSADWSEMRQLQSGGFLTDTEKPDSEWLQAYIPPEDQPGVRAAIDEAIRTKSVFEMEHRVWRADGDAGWTLSRAIPLLGADGEIVEWFGSAADVTKRKQAEAALLDTREKLQAALESTREETRRLAALKEISQIGASSFGNATLAQMQVEAVMRLLETKTVFLWMTGEQRGVLVPVASAGVPVGAMEQVYGPSPVDDETLAATVIRSRESAFYRDSEAESSMPEKLKTLFRTLGLRSAISLPLLVKGEAVGALSMAWAEPRGFDAGEISFLESFASEIALSLQNTRLFEAEHRVATTLQEHFVHALPAVEGLEFAVRSLPANEAELVGGDFSEVCVLEDGQVALLIGDVAGSGVRAAGLTETVRSTVRAFSSIESAPARILQRTNELLLRHRAHAPHVTACLCVLDRETGHLSLTSAGHPAPVHLSAYSCQVLDLPFAPPLGTLRSDHLSTHVTLTLDDYLVLYSDGVTEARRNDELFGERRLVEVVERLRGGSAEAVAQGVADAVLAFSGRLHDDLHVVVVRLA